MYGSFSVFDVIVGNPPYQKEPSPSNYMAPLYHTFTKKSIETSKLVLFITPSRWFAARGALKTFRKFMTSQPNRISLIRTFDEKNKVFGSHVDIKGGVSYFLYNHQHNGKCLYNGVERDLSEHDIIIETQLNSIIKKVKHYTKLSSIGKSQSTFGFNGNDKRLTHYRRAQSIPAHVSKVKGYIKHIDVSAVKNLHLANSWKVLTPAGAWGGNSGLGNLVICKPNEVHAKTYISFFVGSNTEATNLVSYLKTQFANVMISLRKNTQDVVPSCCDWVPLLPLDRTWDDASVYEHLDLTEEEIMLIKETAAKIKGAHNV